MTVAAGSQALASDILVAHNSDGTVKNGAVSAAAMLGASVVEAAKIASGAVSIGKMAWGPEPGGRLTLTSGTPVTTADVTAATTLYYTQNKHKMVPLKVSGAWTLVAFSELSISLAGKTASLPHDVFVYSNSGTPTLELLAWTNDTTRATALAYDSDLGYKVKSGDETRLYLGTIRTTGTTGQTEDSTSRRFVWNEYWPEWRDLFANEPNASWTYTTATHRAINSNTTDGQGRVAFVVGVAGRPVFAEHAGLPVNASNVSVIAGIGLDSTSANHARVYGSELNSSTIRPACLGLYSGMPAAGGHYLQALEYSSALGTTTWIGTGSVIRAGLTARVLA